MNIEILEDLAASAEPSDNMKIDRELLSRVSEDRGFCRIYKWKMPWVTLGRFQSETEALSSSNIPYSVRPTGGSAVLHGHDITVSLAVPLSCLQVEDSRNVRAAYRAATRPIIHALSSSGYRAELGEKLSNDSKMKAKADCFAIRSKNDIVDMNSSQKICGCAQLVEGKAYLLQASIPYQEPSSGVLNWIQGYKNLPVGKWNFKSFPEQFILAVKNYFEK